MKSRPDHIYLMTQPTPQARRAGNVSSEPAIRVNLNALDPARLAIDEDRVRDAHTKTWANGVDALPGFDSLPPPPDDPTVFARWLNTVTSVVDQSAWVLHSMVGLTVAYRGTVRVGDPGVEILQLHLEQDWVAARPGHAIPDDLSQGCDPYFIGKAFWQSLGQA